MKLFDYLKQEFDIVMLPAHFQMLPTIKGTWRVLGDIQGVYTISIIS